MDMYQQLEEICIDRPDGRDNAPAETQAVWPEGWWAVSDGNHGYIAFFVNEADAYIFTSTLKTVAQCGSDVTKRYKDSDEPKRQYGVYDTWKKRWCPRKPAAHTTAVQTAQQFNEAAAARGAGGGANRYEARLLPME